MILRNLNFLKISLLILAAVVICRCKNIPENGEIPDSVMQAINSTTGNKQPLLATIKHYKNSPLKLKAAYYLIENLPLQYYFDGEELKDRNRKFDILDSLSRAGNLMLLNALDSLKSKTEPVNGLKPVRDIDVITEEFLIDNIDRAFIAWNYPWARSLSFEEFCEFILPYKLVDEKPDDWRSSCQKKFAWVVDSLKNCKDPQKVCAVINNALKTGFDISSRSISNWDVNYGDLVKVHTGTCSNAVQYTTYVMRAMGLPVAFDYTQYWANKNSGHGWNALVLNGKSYPFAGTESNTGETKIEFTREQWVKRKRAKVFRHSYQNWAEDFPYVNNVLSALSIDSRNKDVTKEYVLTSDISLKIDNDSAKAKYAYLCVFNRLAWKPVYWGSINIFNYATFKNMGRDIVYLPVLLKQGEQTIAGDPVLLTKEGKTKVITPELNMTETVILKAKYPEDRYEEDEGNRIIAGQHYELFYWNKRWVSLGMQLAITSSLQYKNVPKSALLWLRNLDKGMQERIFLYNDNKQIWW